MAHLTTVAIVGAGEIAGATAQALASRDGARRVLLVDATEGAAAGKALDIRQAGAVDRFHTELDGTNDESRLAGCDACIIADRFGAAGEWRGEDGLAKAAPIAPALGETTIVLPGSVRADLHGSIAH